MVVVGVVGGGGGGGPPASSAPSRAASIPSKSIAMSLPPPLLKGLSEIDAIPLKASIAASSAVRSCSLASRLAPAGAGPAVAKRAQMASLSSKALMMRRKNSKKSFTFSRARVPDATRCLGRKWCRLLDEGR